MVSNDQAKQTVHYSELTDTARSVITLLLILHLFCIFIALSASVLASPLQLRILAVLRPYVRTLNFEIPYAQYHLTHATPLDVDHRIELLPQGASADNPDNWYVLPDVGFRGFDRYKRYQRLGKRMAILEQLSQNGAQDMGAALSEIARGVSAHFVHTGQFTPAQLRCRQHFLQAIDMIEGGTEEQRNPNSDVYFQVPYAANVIVHNGQVSVIKIEQAREVAQPGGETD